MASHSMIEQYLEQLRRRLGRGAHVEHLSNEVSDHLHHATESLVATGVDPATAERLAVERFGEPTAVAKSLMREQVGPASIFTKLAGLVAVGGGLLLVVAFVPAMYSVLMGGPRPRSGMVAAMLLGVAQLALLALLTAVTFRSAAHRRRKVLLAFIVPLGVLSVFNLGYLSVADALDSAWAVAALYLLFAVAQALLLEPWSAHQSGGPAWPRWALLVAATLNVAIWSLQAAYVGVSDGVSNDRVPVSNVLWLLTLPLLSAGMLALGRRLWTERAFGAPIAA